MTLACEDVNSILVGVVTVVDVDAEKRVDSSLVQIWKLNFCRNFFSTFVQNFSLRFGQDFEVEVSAKF